MPIRAEFGIEEGEVELGVVGDQRRVADELDQFVDHRGEGRLVGEEGVGQAMDAAASAAIRRPGLT